MSNTGVGSSSSGMRTRRVMSIATRSPVAVPGSSLNVPESSPSWRDISIQPIAPRPRASAQSFSARAARVDASSYARPWFCDTMWFSSRAECANASHASAFPVDSSARSPSRAALAVKLAAMASSMTPPPGMTRPFVSARRARLTSRRTSAPRASATSRTGWHTTAVTSGWT